MKIRRVWLVALAVVSAMAVMGLSGCGRNSARQHNQRQGHAQAVAGGLAKDAILVVKSATATGSYLGGAPPVSDRYTWPTRDGRALAFLACIDCSELPRSEELDWLPGSGLLLFFYDIEDQPWGFDPKDRGGWATLHVPAAAVSDPNKFASPPLPLPADSVVPKRHVAFRLAKKPPSWESSELTSADLSEDEVERLMEQRSALFGRQPHHQMGGFADPVQNPEMDEECQLASNGIYCGDASGYKDPRVAKLKEGAPDWSLLFQIDSDDDLNIMWGDAGMIYFWVRRDEARKLKFDNTWVILQCG